MAERIRTGYKRLFEVRLLHHYWLDSGATNFDALPETQRNKLLLTFDCGKFISIQPDQSTENKIKALNGVCKNTAIGLVVAVPETTKIADDETFTFILTIIDPAFYNYTALTFISHKIVELYYPAKEKILRFKENVPVFSNLTGMHRTLNSEKQLFLSKEIPAAAANDKVEFLNITAGALVQLSSDQPGATIQQINATALNMPVFVNQNDTPAIIPPAGLTGTPEKGIQLTPEIPDQVFGLISISAVNPSDPDFSCTAAGHAKASFPVFQLRFKNRSAFWKYLNKNTGAEVSESSTPLPFTASGNAGANKRKPSLSAVKVQYQNNDPTNRILKIYTEIFE
jgi:hypothetical protein